MISVARSLRTRCFENESNPVIGSDPNVLVADSRYTVRVASNPHEIAGALRLRYEVFSVELNNGSASNSRLEYDEYDLRCKHLIVIERSSGRTIGTYRINEIGSADELHQLYSTSEFTTEDLPNEVWQEGIEIGRACIAKQHRGTTALLSLWKALARYLSLRSKRFCFGCCSIFTRDNAVGAATYRQLLESGFVDDRIKLVPRRNRIDLNEENSAEVNTPLPPLFESYLRLGARVCSTPMIDPAFGTIDFFVVLDTGRMDRRYRRLFSF